MSSSYTKTLFMNGITVNIPRDTVLEFFPNQDIKKPTKKIAKIIASKRIVEFAIGGLLFRTKAEVVEECAGSLFAAKLSKVAVKKDGVTKVIMEEDEGPEFESPELFPMVFDFLLRRCTTTAPVLRTVELNQRQSTMLDAIEKVVFGIQPGSESWEQEEDELTGPRYYVDREKKVVCVAKPPPGVEVQPKMCVDPLMVHLVMDQKPTKEHSQRIAELKRRYAIDAIDLALWGIAEIPRGMPFAFREGVDGLEVLVQGMGLGNEFGVRVA